MLLSNFNVAGNNKRHFRSSGKVPEFLLNFNKIWNCPPISIFIQICPVGAVLLNADRQRDREADRQMGLTKQTGAFSDLHELA